MEIIVYAQKLMDLEDTVSILIYEIYCIWQKILKTVEITKYFLFRFRLPSSSPLSVFSALEFFLSSVVVVGLLHRFISAIYPHWSCVLPFNVSLFFSFVLCF